MEKSKLFFVLAAGPFNMEKSKLFFVLAAVLTTMLVNVYCEEQCGENQEWNTCGGCADTCKDVANIGAPKICHHMCEIGCECKRGFVLNSAGKCVHKSECTCQEHAHYAECIPCPLTCANHAQPPEICTKNCVSGCTCDEGYVKMDLAGQCVLPENCPVAEPQ